MCEVGFRNEYHSLDVMDHALSCSGENDKAMKPLPSCFEDHMLDSVER